MRSWLLALALFLSACARAPVTERVNAMRPIGDREISFLDSQSFSSLKAALRNTIKALRASSTIPTVLQFGSRTVAKENYVAALQNLDRHSQSLTEFTEYVKTHFDILEAFGGKEWGQVLVTGYYEPIVPGSKRATKKFSQPIYQVPKDLVVIDIGAYADRYPELESMRETVVEQKSRSAVLRGRIEHRPGQEDLITPYYERGEIDGDLVLKGRGLEIAYLDPIDAFFSRSKDPA